MTARKETFKLSGKSSSSTEAGSCDTPAPFNDPDENSHVFLIEKVLDCFNSLHFIGLVGVVM